MMPPMPVPDGVEEGDCQRARLHREDLAHRQVGRARAGGSQEEGAEDERLERPRRAAERMAGEQRRHQGRDQRRAEVGARDHRLPPDGVEEPAEEQRAEEVPDREHDEEDRDEARGHVPERRVEDPEVERHAVVEEGLADEQREAEDRAPRVALEGGLGDLAERDRLALPHGDRLLRLVEVLVASPARRPARSSGRSAPPLPPARG